MSTNVRYALIILIAILAWLFSGVVFNGDAVDENLGSRSEERPLTKIVVLESFAQVYEPLLSFNARTEAYRMVNIRAETSGPIVSTDLDEGSQAITGQRLAAIGIEDRQLRIQEAQAVLDQAEIEYHGALDLEQKGLLSNVEIARKRSAVDSAKAALESARLESERVVMTAPFSGILNERFFEVGDYVQRGQAYAEFLQLNPIKAVFHVSGDEVTELDESLPVALELSDGTVLVGDFLFHSVKAESKNRAFKAEALFDNPDSRVLADLTGVVRIAKKAVLAHAVPAAILSLDTSGELIVKVVNGSNEVLSYPVEIVTDEENRVWITGLPDSARVIVRGYEYVGVGEKVDVSKDDSTTGSHKTESQ